MQANPRSTLNVTSSILATGIALMSNGNGAALSIDGTVGAVAGTISGGKIEFKGASAAAILFAPGQVGTLKLDSSFTGTVAGFAGHQPLTFTNFFAFGDSSIDSGSWQFLAPALGHPHLTARLQNALASGGTNAPVGVGLMNVQDLAADFGLTADTAYTTGGCRWQRYQLRHLRRAERRRSRQRQRSRQWQPHQSRWSDQSAAALDRRPDRDLLEFRRRRRRSFGPLFHSSGINGATYAANQNLKLHQ